MKFNIVKILLVLSLALSTLTWFDFIKRIDEIDLSTDEAVSALLSQNIIVHDNSFVEDVDQSLQEQISLNPIEQFHLVSSELRSRGETHPGLFYFKASFWYHLFGDSRFSMRSFSVVGSLFFLFILFLFGRSVESTNFGFLLVVLAINNLHFLEQSINARMHIWTLVYTALSYFYFYRFFFKDRKSIWPLAIALTLLGLNSFLALQVVFVFLFISFYLCFQKGHSGRALLSTVFMLGLYFVFYGFEQLQNIPEQDFIREGVSRLETFKMIFLHEEDGLIAMLPFNSWFRFYPWFWPSFLLLFFYFAYQSYKYRSFQNVIFLILNLCVLISPYILDLVYGSQTSLWGKARAINFILIPLLIFVASTLRSFPYKLGYGLAFIAVVFNHSWATYLNNFHYAAYKGSLGGVGQRLQREHHLNHSDLLIVTNATVHASLYKQVKNIEAKEVDLLHFGQMNQSKHALFLNTLLNKERPHFVLLFLEHSRPKMLELENNIVFKKLGDHRVYLKIESGEVIAPTGPYDSYSWYLYQRR